MKKAHFGIVASLYNREYTDALLASAQKTLAGHGQTVVRVPGAFEIPLAVQRMAKTRKYAAILALGLVWEGQTAHASEIIRAVTDGLMQVSLETNVPVVHAVLSVKNETQARARCLGKKLNRGTEAAKTALFLAR